MSCRNEPSSPSARPGDNTGCDDTAANCPLDPTVHFIKIETTEVVPGPAPDTIHSNDDFAPDIGEVAHIHVEIRRVREPFNGTVRIDIGRLTDTANDPTTTDVNESFVLLARLEKAVSASTDPTPVMVEWDGKATTAAGQQFSDRKTRDNNAGSDVNIPMDSVSSGDFVPHGLYVIDQVTLIKGGAEISKDRPASAGMSVPMMANLTFNGNWPGNLDSYGLRPFQNDLEEALRRFGTRDYMTRSAVADRINVRFVTDTALGNSDSMRLTIGGTHASQAGSTPDGPAPLSDNIYAIHDGLGADISIFPGTFMMFNNYTVRPRDQTLFRASFSPLGVEPAATNAAPGTATARSVDGGTGAVKGAASADDADNVTVTLDDDGMATVVSTDAAKVPAQRATDIQRALRAFVRMVGNTINHELAHGLGVASRVRANNKVTIGGTTVTSPLDGDGGAHNKTTNATNIVDSGGTRSFERRIENTGTQQKFSATNAKYMRECIPYDPTDD